MKYLARRYVISLIVLLSLSFVANIFILQNSLAKHTERILNSESIKALPIVEVRNIHEAILFAKVGLISHISIPLFLVHLLIFLILAIVLYRLTKKSMKQIEELSSEMDNFSFTYSEEFPRMELEGKEQISSLVRSFNQLRHKVLETVSDIKEMSNYKQEFMTNVTHELKTPLTSVLGYIETLEAGALDEPEHNRVFLEAIRRNVERLSALVGDILNLSKIENRPSVKKRINVLDVFQLVANDYDLYNRKNVVIVINYRKIIMNADPDEIYSAFSNYITNALKYSPTGDIRIKLTMKDNQLFFSVRDSGPGIEQEHTQRVFERFYRIDKGRSRKDGGTGLGLAIVKKVVEKYGGIVGITSFVGKGSEFYFTLPLESIEE